MGKTKEATHIRVSGELKEFIEKKGIWGESHDKILRRLLKFKKLKGGLKK